jgi:hypothetical protein
VKTADGSFVGSVRCVVNPQRREADAVALRDELAQIAERLREKRPGF